MACDMLVYHPLVEKLIKFLDTTAGREKVLRLLQYLSRFVAFNQGSLLAKSLQVQFTLVRKILRFLKPLNHLQSAGKLYNNKIGEDFIVRWCNVIKNLFYAGYLTMDQINLLRILKIIPLTKFNTSKVPKITNYFWFFGLLTGIVLDLRKLQLANLKVKEEVTDADNEKVSKATDAACKAKHAAIRRLAWDLSDTFIVLNNLNYLSSREDVIGLAGVVTSFWGLQDLWKTA